MQLTLSSNKDGLVSLTDIYRQAVDAGMASGKRPPSDWSREAGAQFIDFIAENLNTRKTGVYKTTKLEHAAIFPVIALQLKPWYIISTITMR